MKVLPFQSVQKDIFRRKPGLIETLYFTKDLKE